MAKFLYCKQYWTFLSKNVLLPGSNIVTSWDLTGLSSVQVFATPGFAAKYNCTYQADNDIFVLIEPDLS